MSSVNRAHRVRKPWRNATGRPKTQVVAIRNLEQALNIDPRPLGDMSKWERSDYIGTLSHRMNKRRGARPHQ